MRKIFILLNVTLIFLLFVSIGLAQGGEIMVTAHRGASGYCPENTLSSFKKAIELKAGIIELDVHRSLDGEIVVIHDDKVDRTTNGKGKVKELTLKELQSYDAGAWFAPEFKGEHIPTLREVIKLIKGKILLNIEIKAEGCEEGIVKIVKEEKIIDQIIVSSFHHQFLKKIKKINPQIKTAALVTYSPDLKSIVEDIKADALNIRWEFLNESILKKAHQLGLEVNVWTVNDREAMKKMIELGVDGIITNYPDKLLELLAQKTQSKEL